MQQLEHGVEIDRWNSPSPVCQSTDEASMKKDEERWAVIIEFVHEMSFSSQAALYTIMLHHPGHYLSINARLANWCSTM